MKCIFFILAFAFGSIEAQAAEWRLIGPAVSWHADSNGARVEQPAAAVTTCSSAPSSMYPGFKTVNCRDDIAEEKTSWSQFNPAIGVERLTLSGDMTIRDFGQLVRDSYGDWGLMAGRGFTWQIVGVEGFSLDAGVAGGLWYRTTAITTSKTAYSRIFRANGRVDPGPSFEVRQTLLQRRVVPFVLPLISITHRSSGIALNVSVLPKTSIGGHVVIPTTTVMVQTSFPFSL